MSKHCIACKREIAPGQQECFICGSSQSFVRYYLKEAVFFLLVLGVLSWFGYKYLDQTAKQAEEKRAIEIESRMQVAAKKIEDLENLLAQANKQIQEVEANSAQSTEAAGEEKLKLDEAEKKAKKAEERAGWLSKENRRFKAKVKELTEQLSTAKNAAKNTSASPPAVNPQLVSLKSELAGYESQRQTLVNNIAAEKRQLEAGWQPASGSDAIPPTAEVVAQRALQIEQATANEARQILVLDGQIETVKGKILAIEGGR